MNKRWIALLAGALLTVLSFGCGGDDDDATASVTKAQFITQADAACREGLSQVQADYRAYQKDHSTAGELTEDEYDELIGTVFIPNAEQEVEDLREIGAPSNDEDQVEAFIESREETIEKVDADPEAFVKGEGDYWGTGNKLAEDYGLKACAER